MLLRPKYEFTYTTPLSNKQIERFNTIIDLSGKKEPTESESLELTSLLDSVEDVTQVKITVAQANGYMQSIYKRLTIDASLFFTEMTGMVAPFKFEDLNYEQKIMLNISFDAAAAIASVESFEMRVTKPCIVDGNLSFQDTEWISGLPEEYNTVKGFFLEIPEPLREKWVERAYEANPNLWRVSTDETIKNFGAVSEKELTKR